MWYGILRDCGIRPADYPLQCRGLAMAAEPVDEHKSSISTWCRMPRRDHHSVAPRCLVQFEGIEPGRA